MCCVEVPRRTLQPVRYLAIVWGVFGPFCAGPFCAGPHAVSRRILCLALCFAHCMGAARPADAQGVEGADQYPAAVAIQSAMIDAIARAEKSVVAIARVRKRGAPNPTPDADFGNDFPLENRSRGLPDSLPTSPEFIPNEFGTGVVIDDQGHILTNYHVLGNPDENDYFVWAQRRPFRVTRVEVPEQVKAGDPWTDLAILKIAAKDLVPITMGDTSELRKGMLVVALGNPYGIARDGEVSASWGIISNLRRSAPAPSRNSRPDGEVDSLHQYGTLIQTDARLNLGTSGGALVNLRGEMIGLTTSLTALSGYEQPAGFAIPVDESFLKTVETLKQGRAPAYGFLGIQPDNLPAAERRQGIFGARVLRVVPGTPADHAGLLQDDLITHVDSERVHDRNGLFRELSKRPAESHVRLTVQRRSATGQRRQPETVNVVLSKKFIETGRQPFAQTDEPKWRGLRVEFPSALAPEFGTLGTQAVDRDGCVAVLEVERDTPTWRSGLRRGEYISHVDEQRVATPKQFYDAVADRRGEVRLRLTVGDGDDAVRTVRQ